MRKTGAALLAVLIAVSGSALALIVTAPLVNNYTAKTIARRLAETPLPPETELCGSLSAAGKLTGNSNGMQFFGAVLIRTGLTEEQLEEHYAPMRKEEWQYQIEPQTGPAVSAIEHGGRRFSALEEVQDFRGYFIVYSWGTSGYPFQNLDLRAY